MISLLPNAAPRDLSTGLAILNAISDPAKAMLQKIAEEKAEVQKALKEAQAAQANLASKKKGIRRSPSRSTDTREQVHGAGAGGDRARGAVVADESRD